MLGSTFSDTQLKRVFLIFLSVISFSSLSYSFLFTLSLRKSSAFPDAIPTLLPHLFPTQRVPRSACKAWKVGKDKTEKCGVKRVRICPVNWGREGGGKCHEFVFSDNIFLLCLIWVTTERGLRSFISHQAADGRQHEKIMELKATPQEPKVTQEFTESLATLDSCEGSGPAGSVIQFLQHSW